ncbi:MAG TPA: IPT/TIG domain-containing protein [Pyrinomonadaceae bacterium]|nr:IPT/TIG domain-containing protein [Pyrinomonadaceae bacterium]
MKKSLICAALLIFISCLAAARSNAQQIYLFSQSSCEQDGVDCASSIGLYGGTIYGYSATEVDYWTSDDYSAYVDGQLYDQNGILLDNEWDEEDFIAEVNTLTSANPGTIYTERGYHDVIARYYYEDIGRGPEGCSPCDGCNTDCYYFYDNWYWSDPFGFSFMNGGYFGSWENVYGFGPPAEIENDETISLGQTSQSVFVGWRITSISPSRGPVGTTVPVIIFGSGFSQFGSNTVSASGYGVTATEVNFISSGVLSANFQITSDASAGNHSVRVTINGFPSNSLNFFVQVPTGLSVVGITVISSSPVHSCWVCLPGNDTGIQIATQYQVMDQHGDPILSSAMAPEETLKNLVIGGVARPDPAPGFTNLGGSCYPTDTTTDANGRFLDAPFGWCAPYSTSSLSVDQAIRMSVGSSHYTVRMQSFTGTSSGPGHGTISNGSDVSASR